MAGLLLALLLSAKSKRAFIVLLISFYLFSQTIMLFGFAKIGLTRGIIVKYLGPTWFTKYKINMVPIMSLRGGAAMLGVAGLTIIDSKVGLDNSERVLEIVNKSYTESGTIMPAAERLKIMQESRGPIKAAIFEGYDFYTKGTNKTASMELSKGDTTFFGR